MEVPLQLRDPSFRFVKVDKGQKKPKEKGWLATRNYPFDSLELKRHIDEGGNYGIACGFGQIAVLDADMEEVAVAVEAFLPQTFTVKTKKGKHFYFKVSDMTNKLMTKEIVAFSMPASFKNFVRSGEIDESLLNEFKKNEIEISKEATLQALKPNLWQVNNGTKLFQLEMKAKDVRIYELENGKKKHYGEVLWTGFQALAPGSIHPEGAEYQVLYDVPIASISVKDIRKVMHDWLKDGDVEEKLQLEESEKNAKENGVVLNNMSLDKIISFSKMKKTSNGYVGSHPSHGSETGHNFSVTADKMLWHCFHGSHDSGGDALYLIAVMENVIECEEARSGGLTGEKFKKVLKLAREKYKYDIPEKTKKFSGVSSTSGENPIDAALEFLSTNVIKTASDTKEIYYYKDGVYHKGGEGILETFLSNNYSQENTFFNSGALFHVRARSYVSRELLSPSSSYIHLLNGIYDLNGDSLLEFDPRIFSLTQMPITFNPRAECPEFLKFLPEVVKNDDIPIVQEMFGYCLLKDYPFHKAFMFIGDGRNGKSTLLEVLRQMLGPHNCSSVPLQDFDGNRFSKALLYGKLANIYSDLPDRALQHTGVFKALTGGDTVEGEKKFQSSFPFKNFAKMIFSCNLLPKSSDDTGAFFARWIIINFPNRFVGDDADPFLLKKLTTPEEISGIFNWSLKGLDRLLQKGQFSHSKSIDDMREQYERLSDPINGFFKDRTVNALEARVSKAELYNDYVEYCKTNDFPIASNTVIGRDIKKYCNVSVVHERHGTQRVEKWKGLRLKTDEDQERDEVGVEEVVEEQYTEIGKELEKKNVNPFGRYESDYDG